MNMETLYRSTRSDAAPITASQAILQGIAPDGGLYVPVNIPKLDMDFVNVKDFTYQEIAYKVMSLFFTDFTEEELKDCINKAYDSKFDTEEIAPLVQINDSYFLELFHGATIAFKDMALSILPHLMTTAARKNQIKNEIVILTATSGDTGKAALAGFADVPGTRIVVFYPKGGVSKVQERQMVTQKGENTHVVGITSNFDDCQSGVKALFCDEELKNELNQKGYQFSSANSINIGRLIPQVAYYVFSYMKLRAEGHLYPNEEMNVVVPTGNFGNILAAYIAKRMGTPIDKLICASNDNKVLYDFFNTGVYDKNREFILTCSPSMDILISSNLERLIFFLTGNDAQKNAALMQSLKETGKYEITDEMKAAAVEFVGEYATEAQTIETIADYFKKTGYVLDPHTAVAAFGYNEYLKATNDTKKTLIVSTASPYKFSDSVMKAIAPSVHSDDPFVLIDELSKASGVSIPKAIDEIKNAPVRHTKVASKEDMKEVVKEFLNI